MADDDVLRSRTDEGRLVVWEEEGGHASPYIAIDGFSLAALFEEVTEKTVLELDRMGGTDAECFKVRVTIELLERPTVSK